MTPRGARMRGDATRNSSSSVTTNNKTMYVKDYNEKMGYSELERPLGLRAISHLISVQSCLSMRR